MGFREIIAFAGGAALTRCVLAELSSARVASTPMVRLTTLAARRAGWAKLEYVHPSGSIYDRVAAAMIVGDQPAVVAGSGAWCLAIIAARARRGAPTACAVVPSSHLYEHRVLLASTGTPIVAASEAEWEAVVAGELERRGAVRVGADAAVHFASTLGAELAADRAAARETPPEVLVAADDAHGLVEGLRRAGHRVVAVRAARGARRLEGLRAASASVDAVVVDDDAASAMRVRAAKTEGLLVGHVSAAVLHAALSLEACAVAILIDAGDRVFSRDREAA